MEADVEPLKAAGVAAVQSFGPALVALGLVLGTAWAVAYTAAPMVISELVADEVRARAIGYVTGTVQVGFGAGPLLGGALHRAGLSYPQVFLAGAALAVAAIALGELVRARRRIHELTERQIALAAEHRLAAHKQELSRELHDSIGHTLTVAALHAGVAKQESHRDPVAAAQALDQVTASVSVL